MTRDGPGIDTTMTKSNGGAVKYEMSIEREQVNYQRTKTKIYCEYHNNNERQLYWYNLQMY